MTSREFWLYRYQRTGPQNVSWERVRQLSEDEYKAAGAALALVSRAIEGIASYAEIALEDLDRLVADLLTWKDRRLREEFHEWTRVLRYRIVAVSAAIRMHEEGVLAAAEKRSGKKSSDYEAARAIFSAIYDSSTAYGALYYFRNAVAHGSRSMGVAFARSWIVQTNAAGERLEQEVRYNLSREATRTSGWKAPLRDAIVNLAEDPDLIEWSTLAVEAIRARRSELDELVYPDLLSAVETLRPYYNEFTKWRQPPRFHGHDAEDPRRGLEILGATEMIGRYVRAWRS